MDEPKAVSPDVVQRLEQAERDACADFYAAAPEALRASAGIFATRFEDGVLTACRAGNHVFFNRLQGFGVERPATPEGLDRAIAAFASAGVSDWMIQVAPPAARLAEFAEARGLVRHRRTWAKFLLDPRVAPKAQSDLVVREVDRSEAKAFADPVAEAFHFPDFTAEWLAGLVGRPNWRVFAGFDGETGVSGGAVWMRDGVAWLGFGGTRTSHRGHGLQKVLLARRIEAALAEGCDLVSTETGVPHPGEAGPSFANIQRAGFKLLYERPNYCRPQP